MPKCGNCKADHPSVADIRACYEHAGKPTINTTTLPPPGAPAWPPSDKQLDYLMAMQDEKELPENHEPHERAYWAGKEKDEVSAQISLLLTYPWKGRRASDNQKREYTMPEGRYALQDDDNVWRFYEVSRSDKPRWKGYTFIKMLVGAPGAYNKVDLKSQSRRYAVLDIIEGNAKQAMVDYGLQSGVCGRCASPLSDPQSLERGLGPKCATMSGWF